MLDQKTVTEIPSGANLFGGAGLSAFSGRFLTAAGAILVVLYFTSLKNHGGWVGVDSKPNMGTTVEIYLPLASNWSEE